MTDLLRPVWLHHIRRAVQPACLAMLLMVGVAPAQAQEAANVFNYSRSSSFEYNAQGQVSAEIIEPDNPQLCVRTEHTYNTQGNRTASTTKNCTGATGTALFTARSSTTGYDSLGQNPIKTTNAINQSETKTYDARFGAVTKLTGPNGLSTTWTYDDWGRKTKEVRADGTQTTWAYEYCNADYGSPVASTACPSLNSGNAATLAYVITVTPRDSAGAQNGPQSREYVDLLGRTIVAQAQRAFDSAWIYTETIYNALGQVTKKTEPTPVGQSATYFTSFTYDAIDRVVQETHPDRNATGGQATSSISYQGRTTVTTNARGQKETKEKDPMGRLARVTDNQGNQLAYQYDAFDNLLKTVDPLGNSSTLRYDLRGRKIAMNDPDMGAWSYGYDALGQLISQTDAKGQTTTQQYDLLGRLTSKLQATQKNYWVYDQYADGTACTKGIGKLCETYSDNGYRNKVSYDSLGRAITSTTTVDTAYTSSTTYDAQGRVSTQTWPTGIATKNTYNTLGALTSINLASNNQVLWQPLAYNERGQLTRFKYGNGVETTTTYAADTGKIQAIQAGTGNAVQNQQYQFDEVGNLTQRIDSISGVTETYTYDSLNRLQTQSLIAGSVTRINSWQYNALGNILTQTEVGAYLYNASGTGSTRPHATTQVLGTVGQYIDPKYTYDAAGNLQTVSSRNGNGRSHYFTSFNMPESLASTGSNPASAAFIYGTDSQRVKEILARTQNGSVKTRTVYQIHPDNAGGLYYEKEQKEDGSIEHRHYVGGSILITSAGTAPTTITSTKYWHKDHLGSNVAITNAAGAVIERMAYDPFGKRRTTGGAYDQNGTLRGTNTDRGFTGHEHLDDLGFIHMNGRIFDPTLGRFLSADPYIQYADNIQSYNRYSYLMNNPLNATDPTGFFGWKKWISRSATFGGFVGIPSVDMRRGFNLLQAQPGQSRVDGWVANNPTLYAVGQIAVTAIATYFGGPQAGAGASAAWASYYAYYQTGDVGTEMKAGAVSYASSMMFYGAGQFTEGMSWFVKVGAHAVAGCASAELGGGNCGQGALSAAVAKGITVGLDSYYRGQGLDKIPFEVGFPSAIVSGGIAAQLGGGKFANGAVSAAFGYLLRGAMTSRPSSADNPPAERNIELACLDACVLEGTLLITVGEAVVGTGAAVGIVAYWDKFTTWVGNVYDGLIYNGSGQRPSKTPNTGTPCSWVTNPGSGQERYYGPDGRALIDIDWDHDHGQGVPHQHDWVDGKRGLVGHSPSPDLPEGRSPKGGR